MSWFIGSSGIKGFVSNMSFARRMTHKIDSSSVGRKAADILRAEIKASPRKPKSGLSKAIERLMGKRSTPIAEKIARSIVIDKRNNGVFVGVMESKTIPLARMHDQGRRSYVVPVTQKTRRLFLALFMRGLIKAPIKGSTKVMKIKDQKGHGWLNRANQKIFDLVGHEVNLGIIKAFK